MLEDNEEDGVLSDDGVSVPVCEAERPNDNVVVGVHEEEELTLTVVEGVIELVPDEEGVEVLVSEPLDVCVGVIVPVGLPEEVDVAEFVAIAVPVACDEAVKALLFTAENELAAVILVLEVPMIPVNDAIEENEVSDVEDSDSRPLLVILAVAELDLEADTLAVCIAESVD